MHGSFEGPQGDRDLASPTGYRPGAELKSLSDEEREVILAALPYTMTGLGRLHALVIAVRHLIAAGVPGAFAECGVWRGGSVFAIAATLRQVGAVERDLYLYDTFEGMTQPSGCDTSVIEGRAAEAWRDAQARGEPLWSPFFSPELVNEQAVSEVVLSSGYPSERVHLIRGRVEDTLPATVPDRLALLRLDTDWYESTSHELRHLYPRLSNGGVLILDDYGHWDGARRAVDEYFARTGERILLSRVDYACRLGVKP